MKIEKKRNSGGKKIKRNLEKNIMDFIERYSYIKNKHPAHRKTGRE